MWPPDARRVHHIGFDQPVTQTHHALAALGDLQCHRGVGLRQQHHKFLTAKPCDQVARPVECQVQRLRDIDQASVAFDMPVKVVVLLEKIKLL